MTDKIRTPAGFGAAMPSPARMYDYYLGGNDHLAVDREAAEKVLIGAPEIRRMARENRAFLGRVVRFLAHEGVRQFIDIGTGLPTQGNVHEVAQEIVPDARVAYVDHDPGVLAHGRAVLGGTENVLFCQEDLRWPEDILGRSDLRELIDLDAPVAVLFLMALLFVPASDDPLGIVSRYREALAPGSYLAVSNPVEDLRPSSLSHAQSVYQDTKAASGGGLCTREQVACYFGDFEMVEPGLVSILDWRPDTAAPADNPDEVWLIGGVARAP